MKDTIDIQKIKTEIRQFCKDRDWDQYHSPKNVAAALSVEASELLEIFQWVKEDDSRKIMLNEKQATHIKEEISDVFYYLVRMADLLNIDIEAEFYEKMKKNALKYPATHAAK